jgi:large subunit ribosomal protein L13
MKMVVVDAKGLVAGRLASKVAKRIINGEMITIVNAEEAVVVGTPSGIMEKFELRVAARVLGNPHDGPKYNRIPDRMLRKMVRNMLPTKKRQKKRIIDNLMVFNKVPKELAKEKTETFEDSKCNERYGFMTLKEVAQKLGGTW